MRDVEPVAEGKLCPDSWTTDTLRYLFSQPLSFKLIYYTTVDNKYTWPISLTWLSIRFYWLLSKTAIFSAARMNFIGLYSDLVIKETNSTLNSFLYC